VVSPDVATIAGEADAVVLQSGLIPPARARARTAPSACRPAGRADPAAALAANKNVIVVITSGGGVDMNAWVDRVLLCSNPGTQDRKAYSSCAALFGDTNPSGKLPVSFDRRFEENAVSKELLR